VGTAVHEKMHTSGGLQKAKQGIPSSGSPEEMLNGEPYFIERNEKQPAACDVCKANKLAKRNNILLQDFVPVVTWSAIYICNCIICIFCTIIYCMHKT
jgi:hypothetical protein